MKYIIKTLSLTSTILSALSAAEITSDVETLEQAEITPNIETLGQIVDRAEHADQLLDKKDKDPLSDTASAVLKELMARDMEWARKKILERLTKKSGNLQDTAADHTFIDEQRANREGQPMGDSNEI